MIRRQGRPDMTSFLTQNAHYLLLAILGIWFAMRFVILPRGSRKGLATMFRRERGVERGGLGEEAIRTLLQDSQRFVTTMPDLRGLLLAGPFAAGRAQPSSTITLICLAESTARFEGPTALALWSYPARDHAILRHEVEAGTDMVLHRLGLHGAPPTVFAFVPAAGHDLPPGLREAIGQGLRVIEDPAGQAQALRQAWLSTLRA
jgi:hypothetical protein